MSEDVRLLSFCVQVFSSTMMNGKVTTVAVNAPPHTPPQLNFWPVLRLQNSSAQIVLFRETLVNSCPGGGLAKTKSVALVAVQDFQKVCDLQRLTHWMTVYWHLYFGW